MTITSIERIEKLARESAKRYSDINDACPYPWGTDAALVFKRTFEAERAAMQPAAQDATPEESQA